MTNLSIRDKLPGIKLNKLSEDVLFYLFYNCPGEIYQMAAANELLVIDCGFFIYLFFTTISFIIIIFNNNFTYCLDMVGIGDSIKLSAYG